MSVQQPLSYQVQWPHSWCSWPSHCVALHGLQPHAIACIFTTIPCLPTPFPTVWRGFGHIQYAQLRAESAFLIHQLRSRQGLDKVSISYADSVLRQGVANLGPYTKNNIIRQLCPESTYEAPYSEWSRGIGTPLFESVFRNAVTEDGVGACFPT